ncbi:MAG: 2-amino-4-hydroxy-6-hydroxymethyldihydropteridine diphosphokinase [Coriobacteriia bacterium]|nr:2-amino-4-hydroxy-6-hydroxymethyldihydropteridine diphosphokinase [Coriobacteriia bacterium]
MKTILLLGSNRGDKLSLIERATEMVSDLSSGECILSSLFESEPWGFKADEWFLNRAVLIDTEFRPEELLEKVLNIEKKLGRVRGEETKNNKKDEEKSNAEREYGSREIDIDIIFYGNLVYQSETLTLPHPRMHLRRFVLEPVSQVAPNFIHPDLGVSVEHLLSECEDNSAVNKITLK